MKVKLYLSNVKLGGLTYVGEFVGLRAAASYVKENVDIEYVSPLIIFDGELLYYYDWSNDDYGWKFSISIKDIGL